MFKKTKNRLRLLSSYFDLKKKRSSIDEYADFILGGCWQLFKPLQVKAEITALLSIIEQQKPKHILEIGTANGGTLFLFARVAADDALLVSLDLPRGNFGGGYSPIRIPLYRGFARDQQEIRLIRGDSHEQSSFEKVASVLKGNKLDFLFIDGDHSYEGVKRDFELYSQLVKKGGIVAFHDIATHAPDDACDVDQYWHEIKKHFTYQEIVQNPDQGWAGIGLLFL